MRNASRTILHSILNEILLLRIGFPMRPGRARRVYGAVCGALLLHPRAALAVKKHQYNLTSDDFALHFQKRW